MRVYLVKSTAAPGAVLYDNNNETVRVKIRANSREKKEHAGAQQLDFGGRRLLNN